MAMLAVNRCIGQGVFHVRLVGNGVEHALAHRVPFAKQGRKITPRAAGARKSSAPLP